MGLGHIDPLKDLSEFLIQFLGTSAIDSITAPSPDPAQAEEEFRTASGEGIGALIDKATGPGSGINFAAESTGIPGTARLFKEDPGLFDFLDALGLAADVATPGIPLMAAFSGLAPLFHGTIADNVPRILKKGIEAVRDIGPRGFSNSKKRIAAFATEDPNIAAAFAGEKARRVAQVDTTSFLDDFFQDLKDFGGEETVSSFEKKSFTGLEINADEVQEAVLNELSRSFPNTTRGMEVKPTEVVLGLSGDVRQLPHIEDKLFPSEQASIFEQGIPPEFIDKAFIPREGARVPGIFEATEPKLFPFTDLKAPEGFDQVTLDGLMRFLQDLGLFK